MVPSDELEGYPKRTRSRRLVASTVLAVALAGLVLYGLLNPADRETAGSMPDFSLPLLAGDGTLGKQDLLGDPVVVNFWASWCIPCRTEMPLFEQIWQEHRDEGLQVVGVNIQDSRSEALAFLADVGVTYPTVFDADQTLAKALGVNGLPQTFFVDRDGNLLRDRVLGEISARDLREQVQKLLAD